VEQRLEQAMVAAIDEVDCFPHQHLRRGQPNEDDALPGGRGLSRRHGWLGERHRHDLN
jgi:hypothetical protein